MIDVALKEQMMSSVQDAEKIAVNIAALMLKEHHTELLLKTQMNNKKIILIRLKSGFRIYRELFITLIIQTMSMIQLTLSKIKLIQKLLQNM